MFRKILPYLLLASALGVGIAYYMYNKPHKNLATSKADFILTPEALFLAYDADEEAANELYLDKVIEVEGIIKDKADSEEVSVVTLDTGDPLTGIICEFMDETEISSLSIGDKVKIRGICSGKLMDIVLVRCIIVN